MKKNLQFKDPIDITDDEEEVHKNIDSKSYHKFIREQCWNRLEFLRTKESLTDEEKKEKDKLEYKFLPVDIDLSESTLRTSKEESIDCSDDLIHILCNDSIKSIVEFLDSKIIYLEQLEDLTYFNLSEAIKNGDDRLGYDLCRIGLILKWAREYGRGYLVKIKDVEESTLKDVFDSQYAASKEAILNMALKND